MVEMGGVVGEEEDDEEEGGGVISIFNTNNIIANSRHVKEACHKL